MNMGSIRRLGLVGGAAAVALALGAAPASAALLSGQLELNTAATNCGNNNTCTPAGTGANVAANVGSTAGTFITDGGKGWANLGVSVGAASGTGVSFDFWGSVNIDNFTGVTLLTASKTGVGNAGNDWVFFTTVHITGTGDWSGGKFTAGNPTVTLDLWAAQAGVSGNNFGGAEANPNATGLDDFANLGFAGNKPNPVCYEGGAANSANNCLLLATATGSTAGGSTTGFVIDDSGGQNTDDNITFTIASQFTDETWAYGTNGFFVSPPDPNTFGLVVISGCEVATATPVNIGDPDSATVFQTASAQSGAAACGGSGQAHEHDPVGWAFATTTDVPEPATLAILGSALVGFGIAARRRRNGTVA